MDERLDPEKSTVAAANYLRDLYAVFGSWDLAQAAYNAGEVRVQQAIQGSGTRDFWVLHRRSPHLLPETKNFIPAIHAATLIGRQPEQYGFHRGTRGTGALRGHDRAQGEPAHPVGGALWASRSRTSSSSIPSSGRNRHRPMPPMS